MHFRIATGVFVVVLTACTPAADSDDPSQESEYDSGTHVVLLGTGTPNADPERSGPAVAVLANGTAYLVDAGPGVVRRAAAAASAGVTPLEVDEMHHVFLTHLHSDHTVGLPDLIFTPWVLGRNSPLRVFGPPGARGMVEHILEAYGEDIDVRLNGLEPANRLGYNVDVHEFEAGMIFEDENVRVFAVPVHHGGWEHAFGFRFESADRVIVISGDATPTDAIAEACDGCDVLVHEVYSAVGFRGRDSVWQRYHADAHTSSVQLAELASHARPGLLVLYHQLFWGVSEDDLAREVAERYDGRVLSGRDLDVY